MLYKLPRGTRAALNTLATASGLVVGQLYLITDENRLAVGLTTSTYDTFARQSEAKTGSLNFEFDGGGAALTTGLKIAAMLIVPFACTITGWTALADQSGSAVVDLWKDTYANYPPTSADSITASAKPTITTAARAQSSALPGWTTSAAAGDVIFPSITSVTGIQTLLLSLNFARI